jgi:hypothetical protein
VIESGIDMMDDQIQADEVSNIVADVTMKYEKGKK